MALLSLPTTTPSISKHPKSSEFNRLWQGFLGLSSVKVLGTGISEDSWRNLKICRCNSTSSVSAKHCTSTSVSVADGDEENYIVGDFCPLYSSLRSISMNSGRRCARSGRLRVACSGQNGTPATSQVKGRFGEVVRVTKETNVKVNINLDGSGISNCDTGIPFLDHMLDQIASHGILDVQVKAHGDIHIDDHHTNEDIALALGTCLLQAFGDRKGIYRFGDFTAPLDEALVHVALDLSGRPYLGYDLCIPTQRVGTYDTQLVEHFFQSLVNTSGMTLHIRQLAGKNSHHIIEATFKAFARALRQAVEHDIRRSGSIPSSKGVLSRT